MLKKETIDSIKDEIKKINKLKTVQERLTKMIEVKDDIRNKINDELDELFSAINLKKSKLNLEDD